jgi:hypothetical protein
MKYYKALDVWCRKNEKTIVRYRCFQLLPNGGFSVQSADHYHAPFADSRAEQLDKQFLELFLAEAPEARSSLFPTLDEAVRAFAQEFADRDPA